MRVGYLWIRYSDYNDAASRLVGKIETFADPTPAHTHQNGSITITIAAFCVEFTAILWLKNGRVILIHDVLIVCGLFWLTVDELALLDQIENVCLFPPLVDIVHESVRGEEDEKTVGHVFGNPGNREAELIQHVLIIFVLIAKVELTVIDSPSDDSNEDLLCFDYVRALQLSCEWHLKLCLE